MTEMSENYVRSESPKWLRIVGASFEIITFSFSLFYILWLVYSGQFVAHISRCLILFIIIILIIWHHLKILYYTVTASNRGLETDNIVGKKKAFLWEQIIEVRRPRFGFPVNFTYIISTNEDKIFLIKNRNNYKEIIQSIEENAPNLKSM